MKNFNKISLFSIFAGMFFLTACPAEVITSTTLSGSYDPALLLPQIEILSPALNEEIQTPYTLRFQVTDNSGISSVGMMFGGETNSVETEFTSTTSNTYTFTIDGYPNGYHSVVVWAVDSDGNQNLGGQSVHIVNPDGDPWVRFSGLSDGSYCSGTIALSGFAGAYGGDLLSNDCITVLTNGAVFETTSVSGSNWSVSSIDTTTIPDGNDLLLSVIATADSLRAKTNSILIHIDNSAPILNLTSPANGSGQENSGFSVTATASDSHSPIASTRFFVEGEDWSTNLSGSSFDFLFDGLLTGGDFDFIMLSSNRAGLFAAATNTITVSFYPDSEITNVGAGQIFSNSTVTIAGTASIGGGETITNVRVIIDGDSSSHTNWANPAASSDLEFSSSFDLSSEEDGTFTARAIAYITTTNNEATASAESFILDTDAPTTTFDTSSVSTNGNALILPLEFSAEDLGAGLYSMTMVASNSLAVLTNPIFCSSTNQFTYTLNFSPRRGTNRIWVFAEDSIGRQSSVSAKEIVLGRGVTIDGVNDFDASTESFATSTSGITAYFTYNEDTLYFGYDGGDIGNAPQNGDREKWWVAVYISTNENDPAGLTTGVNYDGQQPILPFTAQYHYRIKTDNSFSSLLEVDSGVWTAASGSNDVSAQSGDFMEFAIPASDLGSASEYFVTAFMIYENNDTSYDSTYGAMIPGNISDGFAANLFCYATADLSDLYGVPNAPARLNTNDNVPPTVSITSPTDGWTTIVADVTVNGTADGTGGSIGSVFLKTNDGAFFSVSGAESWSHSFTSLSAGIYSNFVYALDDSGNSSSTQTIVFTVLSGGSYASITVDGTNSEADWSVLTMTDSSSDSAWSGHELDEIDVAWDADNLYLKIYRSSLNESGNEFEDGFVLYIDSGASTGENSFYDFDVWARDVYFPNHTIEYIVAAYKSGSANCWQIADDASTASTGSTTAKNADIDGWWNDVTWEASIPWTEIYGGSVPVDAEISIAAAVVGGSDNAFSADLIPGASNNGTGDTWISTLTTFTVDGDSDGVPDRLW